MILPDISIEADPGTETEPPWQHPGSYWPAMTAATAELDPPFATLDAHALAWNAADMVRRAAGKPLRIASKSIRVRGVIETMLRRDGFRGVLAFTLPEAIWLAEGVDDIVVGYPTAHRGAIRRLATEEQLARRITVMVDSVDHLDLIDDVIGPRDREPVRVCLELDASWRPRLPRRFSPHIGVRRSPVHSAADAAALARIIESRPGFRLVGMMAYEAQIAGVANAPRGKPLLGAAIRRMQHLSVTELHQRRAEAVAAVRAVTDLEFVNGGGTGSIESTAADEAVTEIAAGSGLYGPHLFDGYRRFAPAPAAAFALPVVRRPAAGMATVLGGGWIASGPPARDRLPQVVWPPRTRMIGSEMAGEVQTPLTNTGDTRVGDRVWCRHTKSGELSEHVNEFAVVCGEAVTEMLPTYRGEGKAFL
jgi:D-serine deaminase-like pyridoxal phosphate-dependent protein